MENFKHIKSFQIFEKFNEAGYNKISRLLKKLDIDYTANDVNDELDFYIENDIEGFIIPLKGGKFSISYYGNKGEIKFDVDNEIELENILVGLLKMAKI